MVTVQVNNLWSSERADEEVPAKLLSVESYLSGEGHDRDDSHTGAPSKTIN